MIVYEANRSTSNPDRLIEVFPFGLTWEGHEFLEAARNGGFWNQAKERLMKVTGGLAVDLLKALLVQYAKKGLGLAP